MPTPSSSMSGLAFDRAAPLRVQLRHDLPRPEPREGEVLVRVTHTTINGHEFELAQHPLLRLLAALGVAPGRVRTGLEFAGVVASQGADFGLGDRVMGYVDLMRGWRAHAGWLAIPEAYLAQAPTQVSPAQAAALPMSALTALVALREVAQVQPGQRVLIVGASGGVGVLAVQIARLLGAVPTAVATAQHHARLLSLGAAEAIDYRHTPVEALRGAYAAVLDFSNTLRWRQVRHLLESDGHFVPADPYANLLDIVLRRAVRWLMVDKGDSAKLAEIAAWVDAGQLQVEVSAELPLHDWAQAVERSHERGHLGRTVLAMTA